MNLNIPDTRQRIIAERLANGSQIVATDVAVEFDVSLDTIRRDILALEADGKARRVRGGAVPIARPASPLHTRLEAGNSTNPAITKAAIVEIGAAPTVLMDGGATTLSIVAHLPELNDRLVITPSPWIAVACQEHDINVFMIGGALSPQGGIATGDITLAKTAHVAADIAVLGVCGLDPEFGLSSDDPNEAQVKSAMAAAANRTVVVTDGSKIGRRARHHTLRMDQIDVVITDATSADVDLLSQTCSKLIRV